MKEHLATFLKGFAMGAANVVPGVSGGTIAYITGIYERLINALKSFDLAALKLLCRLDLLPLLRKIDAVFLMTLFLGVALSIVSLAQVLKVGFRDYPTLVWSLFFGLIVASIPSVGRVIKKWSWSVCGCFSLGLGLAISMALLTPASSNENLIYLLLCGVAGMCSMIIPGLSGSFVLLLMGNYELIALDAINDLRAGKFSEALPILIPVGIGALVGLLSLSRALSWLFAKYHDQAVGSITGFITGSLVIIWPWKNAVVERFQTDDGQLKEKIVSFENWHLPTLGGRDAWLEIGAMMIGVLIILFTEFLSRKNR